MLLLDEHVVSDLQLQFQIGMSEGQRGTPAFSGCVCRIDRSAPRHGLRGHARMQRHLRRVGRVGLMEVRHASAASVRMRLVGDARVDREGRRRGPAMEVRLVLRGRREDGVLGLRVVHAEALLLSGGGRGRAVERCVKGVVGVLRRVVHR